MEGQQENFHHNHSSNDDRYNQWHLDQPG